MGYYSGQDGFLEVDDQNVATVTSWSFTASQETLDVTTLGDHDRNLVGGVRSISGSASISWYSDSTNAAENTQAATLLGKLVKTSTAADSGSDTVAITLGIKNHSAEQKKIKMTVILTSIAMTSSQGEVFSAEVSFEATGVPTDFTLDEV